MKDLSPGCYSEEPPLGGGAVFVILLSLYCLSKELL